MLESTVLPQPEQKTIFLEQLKQFSPGTWLAIDEWDLQGQQKARKASAFPRSTTHSVQPSGPLALIRMCCVSSQTKLPSQTS